MSKVGIFGAGWVGLVTGACFAELGHEVVIRDVAAREDRCAAPRRGSVPRGDVPSLLARNAERLTYTLDVADDRRLRLSCSSASTRRPRIRATRTCRGSGPSIDELPELTGRPMLVMKSTVPVGTGEKVRAGLDQRGLEHVGYVSNPEFLAEGRAGARLHASRPNRDRCVRRRRR